MKHRRWLRRCLQLLLPSLGMSFIYYLSSLTSADFSAVPDIPISDKWAHAIAYAGLTLLFFPWRGCRWEPWEWLPFACATALCFAICDEWHQLSVEGRSWELADLAADAAGVTAAALFCSWRWLRLKVCRIFVWTERDRVGNATSR